MADLVKLLAELTAKDGPAVVAFAVLMALVIYQTVASAKRAKAREAAESVRMQARDEADRKRDEMLISRLIEGDGNGGASIRKVLSATNNAVELAKAADEKADQALTEVREVRHEVVKLRTDGCSQRAEHWTLPAAAEGVAP